MIASEPIEFATALTRKDRLHILENAILDAALRARSCNEDSIRYQLYQLADTVGDMINEEVGE